jgi:hypothetical protein
VFLNYLGIVKDKNLSSESRSITERLRDSETQRGTERHRQTQGDTKRQKQRQRGRQRHIETETERKRLGAKETV